MKTTKIKTIKDFKTITEALNKKYSEKRTCITISSGTCGQARGSLKVIAEFEKQLKKHKLDTKVRLKVTGCHGFCELEPDVMITSNAGLKSVFYKNVGPTDVERILNGTIKNKKIIEHLLYLDPATNKTVVSQEEISSFKKQKRSLLENNEFIDPTDINDYLMRGGYRSLYKALTKMSPKDIIEEVKESGLRGRGGGGFPTGRKWESCAKAKGDVKYLICNADEGDPGCFQDRNLLEGNPHSVLEGMLIGAYAVGAKEGYIYVRNEYPLAVKHVETALKQAKEYGLLGNNIFESDFSFNIKVNRGGGAFVCGESSALMASIEGRLGEPRFKHHHATEKGLWDKPTTLNNVKTWATIPLLIDRGADWFSKIGTENSKGTMIFSLVGNIKNTGLVEVPMGITLRELIYDIGGGIPNGKRFKAVQTGGPSGGCIPESQLDLAVDYDRLTEAGSMMGSGGMIVMDEDACMVNVAKYFLDFTVTESCGKCTPCREGVNHMRTILMRIAEGKGKEGDIELLEEMGRLIGETSLCALGKAAPNPVLTTIRYFRDEYEEHIKNKKCRAGVCKKLISYSIDKTKCTGCTLCFKKCPSGAIAGKIKKPHIIEQDKCIKCGVCFDVCKFDAVKIK